MSDHPTGPFGTNPLGSGTRPYQLPPPRTSAPLQLGTDPFLRQRNQTENREPGEIGSGRSSLSGPQLGQKEQLPSVSHLLTPTAHPSRPSSPYHAHRFGVYTPPTGSTGSPIHLHHNEQLPRHSIHDSTRAYPEPVASQSRSLPPLSYISTSTGLGREGSVNTLHTSPSGQTVHAAPFSYSGHRSHDQEYAGDYSPSETAADPTSGTQSQGSNVRPHVVDEKYIEGEGLCYIYADGTHCPKLIDGMPVNANWGITKAGKPRKRLAQACLTCREKKIKCQPNLPKCDQCQKSGRECRFESAPRGHRAALKSAHLLGKYDSQDSYSGGGYHHGASPQPSYSTMRASESSVSLPGTNSLSPRSEASMITPSAVDTTQDTMDYEPRFRPKAHSFARPSSVAEELPSNRASVVSPDYAAVLKEMKTPNPQDPLVSDWNTDPYEAEPELTVHYVESYFNYVNDRLYYIFPRNRFLLWLTSCHDKSLEDTMLLYAMMALGSVFSDRPDRVMAMRKYARTARYAVEHGQDSLSLQLAQTHIIMSMWYCAIGALVKSWDAAGAAVRTVCGLRYNVEAGGVIVDQNQPCEYGLHPQALIECRRRTFWVAFLKDRTTCVYAPSSCTIPSQTAYLRLPCREEVFEAQEYTTVPYFQSFLNQDPSSNNDISGMSTMARFIEIMSLWGEVSDHVFRLSFIPMEVYRKQFEDFYSTVTRHAEEWAARLPDHLTFTAVNLERSIRAKKADAFMSIHLVYHATLMKLNRHARHQSVRAEVISQHIHSARTHAAEILRMTKALIQSASEYEPTRILMEPSSAKGAILNPFLGYVLLSAVDVLSAAGRMVEIRECIALIQSGLVAINELACFWGSLLPLAALIQERLDTLSACMENPAQAEGKVAFLSNSASLDSKARNVLQKHAELPADEDLMYGELSYERLLSALGAGDGPYPPGTLLWVGETKS
ncbi:Zn(II)2Cys6 transcription factor [Aspergillus saccharolyticus JOP 1030-1]|uniref:C6 transcription factor n=1 Tax=Aspergillus saccharolyticus JOP 1030-1 TaxID=1450539 RepID=A0A318ZEE8_9EURO|nr:C6 transcription factor [Aspergillus saccharolyticus JOP 1030-1]PYH45769.1 C6 transcription factor [Aspergillus saccharolyticus JOP 1030-1]